MKSYIEALQVLKEIRVSKDAQGVPGIYLRAYNVSLATFHVGSTPDAERIGEALEIIAETVQTAEENISAHLKKAKPGRR